MFLSHASGAWLDLKAADYGKKRKQAQKTQGLVTLTRTCLLYTSGEKLLGMLGLSKQTNLKML